jgi:hypothetical protein
MLKRAPRPYKGPRIDFGPTERPAKNLRRGTAHPIREPLSRDGISFLAQMSGKVSLIKTTEGFPHVINKLAPYGYRPLEMINAIDRLLIDDRPARQGFPFAVVRELGVLRETYSRYLTLAR